jgi:hypothetical protein
MSQWNRWSLPAPSAARIVCSFGINDVIPVAPLGLVGQPWAISAGSRLQKLRRKGGGQERLRLPDGDVALKVNL